MQRLRKRGSKEHLVQVLQGHNKVPQDVKDWGPEVASPYALNLNPYTLHSEPRSISLLIA